MPPARANHGRAARARAFRARGRPHAAQESSENPIGIKNFTRRILFDTLGQRRDNTMWRLRVEPIDVRSCGSLLLLNLDGKLGDAVLQSSLLGAVRGRAPECRLTVITTGALAEYWRACEIADRVYVVPSRTEAATHARLLALRRLASSRDVGSTDVALCLDPIPMIDYFAFLRWLRPRAALGLSVPHYALFRISIPDPIIEVPRRHAGERIVRMLAALDVEQSLEGLLPLLPRSTRGLIEKGGAAPNRRTIFVNGFGASVTRTFSVGQIAALLRVLLARGQEVLLNANAEQRAAPELHGLFGDAGIQVRLFDQTAGICALFDAVAASAAVVTPDTGVVHVAAAARVPVVVAYDDVDFNPICWRPLTDRAVSIVPRRPGPIANVPVESLVAGLDRALPA